ncbi:MAG: glycoside hydrolase family 31 protein [Candidatus Sumerlaeia bacterium]|nr:glycoside hydrolase family 31 protein [Candidatus Sumerlaeia bacterium]
MTTVAGAALAAAANGNPIIEGNARFTVVAPECVRLEYAPDGKFTDEPSLFAIERSSRADSVAVRRDPDGALLIDTGRMAIRYAPDGTPFSSTNLFVTIGGGAHPIEWNPSSRQTGNLGGTIATLDQVRGPVPLGEGLLSRDGWFLIDDSKTHLLVDGWAQPRRPDAGTDWFLFGYGSDYEAAFRAFAAAAGKVPMPRKQVLGSWYSRWWHYSSDDYKQIVEEYAEHDFPLDVMVMDMEWHTGEWTGWSWNYELLPDPPALLKYFREQGLLVTLNVHPADGVLPTETMYPEFMATLGQNPASGETVTFDAADRKYMEALFAHTHHPREDEGVDFWWLDWQQYPFTIGIGDLLNLKWLNYLYFENSKRGGKRGLQFSRWGGWGDHRHPIHFSGDADTGWRMLSFEVPFTSTAGNVGCFYWSHDIGGHFGERNEEPYTRWVQFSATTAAMRMHSGIIEYLDRRPWRWPDWATASMRRAFHFRAELMPYVYSSAWQCTADGLPLNRPMYLAYPEAPEAYLVPAQYLFGENILVAPATAAGAGPGRVAAQLVWFPEGTWYNYFTSEKFEGPQWRVVCADINEWPMFVRAGAPLPMQRYNARPTTAPLDELVIKLWPAPEETIEAFTLYEDDGESSDYGSDSYGQTILVASFREGGLDLDIHPTVGEYDGQPAERAYSIQVHSVGRPSRVVVDGQAGDWSLDEGSGILEVKVAKRSIHKAMRIEMDCAEAAPEVASSRAAGRRLEGILGAGAPDNLAEALASIDASTPDDVASALLAMAGLAVIDNETHYPFVGTLRRLVRNADSPIAPDLIDVAWRREMKPSGEVIDGGTFRFDGLAGPMELSDPEILKQPIPFLTEATDVRALTARVGERRVTAELKLPMRYGNIDSWLVSPSFPFDIKGKIAEQNYPPQEIPWAELPQFAARDGWTVARPNGHGLINIKQINPEEERIAYAVGTFDADGGAAVLGFRTDDGCEVWLNGEKIHSVDAFRGINHPWEEARVTLRKGRNVLLLKVSQGTLEWEFMVRGNPAP